MKPTAIWAAQQARQLVWKLPEQEQAMRFVFHDRDAKFPASFDTVFAAENIEVIMDVMMACPGTLSLKNQMPSLEPLYFLTIIVGFACEP